MNIFKSAQRLLLATGVSVLPFSSHAQQADPIKLSDFTLLPLSNSDRSYCVYERIAETNPLQNLIVFTGKTILGSKTFDGDEIIFSFGKGAEFLLKGGQITNLPDTPESAINGYRNVLENSKQAAAQFRGPCLRFLAS